MANKSKSGRQDTGDALRPALPMNRAVFHRLGLTLGIAIALAGCENSPGRTVVETGPLGRVTKNCDMGRAIYTYKAGDAGGIAVVENAKECGRDGEQK